MPSNLDRLKAAYAAWNDTKGASREVWGALMADRFHLNHVDEHSPGLEFARDSCTREEALSYLAAIFDDWEMVHYTPETYVGDGDSIAMFGRCAFRHRKGREVAEMRMACLWRFEGDKAVSMVEIVDSAVAMRVAMAA
ncbi:MAG: nuclear transport factor 2 family protein [Rhizobiaceae bacterium]|nr:nuclear transport factor 2 family protein [Rhizobiaceae bacterium]